jgi:uncharacterized protein (UPF0332 family)
MVVNPDDFNDHADRVNNQFSEEIDRRCVISRKYYYAFHYVRENGRNDPSSNFSNGGGDHKHARDLLRNKGHPQLSQKLFRLHEWRKKSDYDLDKTINDSDLNQFLQRHRQFMNQIQYIL